MIRFVRLLRAAWEYAEADYACWRLSADLDVLQMPHTDGRCDRCILERSYGDRFRDARERWLELRGQE